MSDGRILFLRQEDFENVYRRLDELTERVKEAHERINEMTACVLSPDLARKLQHAHDNPAPSAPSGHHWNVEGDYCITHDKRGVHDAPPSGEERCAWSFTDPAYGVQVCNRDKNEMEHFHERCGYGDEKHPNIHCHPFTPPATARETVADQAWREYGAWVDQHKARCPDCEHDAVELTYLYAEYNRGWDECHGTVPASDPQDRHEAKPSTAREECYAEPGTPCIHARPEFDIDKDRCKHGHKFLLCAYCRGDVSAYAPATAREEWQCDYVYDYGDGKTNPCPYAKTQHNAPGIHEFVKHAPAKAESGKDERRWICTKCVACSCEENEADWIEVVSLAALEAEREKREAAERWEANWRTLHEDLLRRAEAERNEALNHYKEAAARADEVQRYYDEARATVERVRVLATSDLSPYYSYDGVPKSAILAALASEPKGKP